jgi:hypothetical protein
MGSKTTTEWIVREKYSPAGELQTKGGFLFGSATAEEAKETYLEFFEMDRETTELVAELIEVTR